MNSRIIPFAFVLFLIALPSNVNALTPEQSTQEPRAKPKPAQPAQPPQKPADKELLPPPSDVMAPTPEEALQKVLTDLSNQLGSLAEEIKRLRLQSQRQSDTLELLLYEERLARIEEKLQIAIEYKVQLDGREQDLLRRIRNVPQEVALRGALRKDEAEAALRAEYQRALDDVRAQQTAYQQRVGELQAQSDRLRSRVETIRKKLDANTGSGGPG